MSRRRNPPPALVAALVFASATLMTLDAGSDDGSALAPVRQAVGEVFGPVESATAEVARPFTAVPGWFRDKKAMREEIRDLEAENASLREQVRRAGFDRNRLAEYDALTAAADDLGYALVPARVIGMGPSQSFSATVTIDAGSRAGVQPDLTVVNGDGLVGRVLRVTSTTATVLLIIDRDSTVGGRVGSTMDLGFLTGQGAAEDDAGLDLRLVDRRAVPERNDTVVTWGSDGAGPYVPGIPIGRVTDVYSSLRDSSQRAEIEPYVDFAALDLVGVVVPRGTESDRTLIEADGGIGR